MSASSTVGPQSSDDDGRKAALPSVNVSLDPSLETDGRAGSKKEPEGEEEEGEDEADQVRDLPLVTNPASPSKANSNLTAAERRDHSRKHSRVHSRNLSVFFPRPGSEAEQEADSIRAAETFGRPAMRLETGASTLSVDREAVGLSVPWEGEASSAGSGLSPSRSRKGHHRRHSVMHGINEGNQDELTPIEPYPDAVTPTTPYERVDEHILGRSDRPVVEQTDRPAAKAYAHHHRAASSSSLVGRFLSTPLWHLWSGTSLPPSHRPLLVFGTFHSLLGAALWMYGQAGDSLALTGLGYLIVFDAFGVLNSVIAEWITERWRTEHDSAFSSRKPLRKLRRPYGPHRIETLLQFSQTVYLLFAAIYVCKESFEHALLEGSEEHHEQDDVGLTLPSGMLITATMACTFSNVLLQNHAKLVAACGLSTTVASESNPTLRRRGHGRRTSVLVDPSTMAGPLLRLLANPFSVTVMFFSLTLSIASLVMPPFQIAALDKVLAGLESAAMLYIAYPASTALGKILLQTAPKEHDVQNVQLMRTIRTIEAHRLISYVAPPHLWQLTPPTSAFSAQNSTAAVSSNMLLGHANTRTSKNAALIATVDVFVHDQATDVDVLDITRWAWQLLAPAVGAGAGLPVGESLRGALRAGEVIVQVCRASERTKYRHAASHDHMHDHAHDHHDCEDGHKHTHRHAEHDKHSHQSSAPAHSHHQNHAGRKHEHGEGHQHDHHGPNSHHHGQHHHH